MSYKNPTLITSKRKVLELSHSPEQLYYKILLNVFNVINFNS